MWGGKCGRCGADLKLLFSSWYCPCEDMTIVGYALVSSLVHDDLEDPNELPEGFCFHLFKDKKVAKDLVTSFLGFKMLQVDLSKETMIFWSTRDKLWVHEASRNLPCKVVQ